MQLVARIHIFSQVGQQKMFVTEQPSLWYVIYLGQPLIIY